jgi:ABC-type molybdate transport system substrate-binding protein
MLACARIASVAAMLASFAGMAAAAEIRVLSAEALAPALGSLAADFTRENGHAVVFTTAPPAQVMQKIAANEVHDAVIVSEPAMDQLDRDGIVNPESRVRLVADGATTYEGALMSDGSVPEAARAFIRFLASADARDRWAAARLEPVPEH